MSDTETTPLSDDRLELVEAADKLLVTVEVERNLVMLRVDARALVRRGSHDIPEWWLCPSDDGDGLWNHPQSHGDEYFPLVDCLLGIAAIYVRRAEATR